MADGAICGRLHPMRGSCVMAVFGTTEVVPFPYECPGISGDAGDVSGVPPAREGHGSLTRR
jgi:hypothetical protein